MKLNKVLISSITVFFLSGCGLQTFNATPQEIKAKNITPRDVVNQNKNVYKIFDDSNEKTLFTVMGVSAINNINVNNMNISDVERAVSDLSDYCEKIGGEWKIGKRFVKLALKVGVLNPFDKFKALKNRNTNIDGIGRCIAPNGKGFRLYEIGLFDLDIKKIALSLGGGVRIKWHRYFKIEYDKPLKPKKDYVLSSYKPFLEKNKYSNIENVIKDYDRIKNRGMDNYYLITTYPICKYLGGEEYIATDEGTNLKKMSMKEYLFYKYDRLLKKYGNSVITEFGNTELKMFPVKNKGYIWCENKNNPQNQFMLIWNDIYKFFEIKKGLDYNLIKNLKNQYYPQHIYNDNIQKNNFSKQYIDDKNVLNIANSTLISKKDLSVKTPFVNYKSYYLKNFNAKNKIIVERIFNNEKSFYNFNVKDGGLEFKGKTLQGVTKSELNRFDFNEIKKECKLNGNALRIVNGLKLYCKYNNGIYRFFLFDVNENALDIF